MGESKGCPWNFNIIRLPNLPCFTDDQLQIDSIQGRENKTSSKFQNKNIKDKEHEHLWILVFTDCRGPSTNPPWVPRDSHTFFIFLTGMFNIWNVSNIPKKKNKLFKAGFQLFQAFFSSSLNFTNCMSMWSAHSGSIPLCWWSKLCWDQMWKFEEVLCTQGILQCIQTIANNTV